MGIKIINNSHILKVGESLSKYPLFLNLANSQNIMQIIEFIGTCASVEIGQLAEKSGKKSSYKNAKKAIKDFSIDLYNDLMMDFFNPWHEHTNIKRVDNKKYLHVVNSCIDYLFLIN